MFTKESISKAKTSLAQRIRFYRDLDVSQYAICISKGNRKIGRVMNVSLPPILSCANCSECQKLCYDIKAVLQYPNNVADARARNMALLLADRDEYFNRIIAAIKRRRKNKFFRWHVAGDITDIEYFDMMVKIARMFPDFIFWTYTKNYTVVNAWLAAHGGRDALPGNFAVMFSEWRGMPMANPYNMPVFGVVFNGEAWPEGVHHCPGNCDACIKAGRGCVVGETTYCAEH